MRAAISEKRTADLAEDNVPTFCDLLVRAHAQFVPVHFRNSLAAFQPIVKRHGPNHFSAHLLRGGESRVANPQFGRCYLHQLPAARLSSTARIPQRRLSALRTNL